MAMRCEVFFVKAETYHMVKKFAASAEPRCLLKCLQKSAAVTYIEPDNFKSRLPNIFL
jgi:hypothetical protein